MAFRPIEGPSVDFSHGDLEVSENKRFLQHSDGTPFFYLGDTAWELFHRLTREEAEEYLEDRRRKGFTVIQAVALGELDGLHTPNAYGHRPLVDDDPARPAVGEGEDYWDHVDFVIDRAAEKGLYVGLLPTWGDKVDPKWGKGPKVFIPENARVYGEWIGRRYGNRPNIIWINGGDRPGGGENAPIWRALGETIKRVDGRHLMTFHPMGGESSATWFHEDGWLDFNAIQSGHHAIDNPNYKRLSEDYQRVPTKPVFDSEPRYEDHPINWKPENGWFEEFDVRQATYWGIFCGGHGITYGAHGMWQFLDEGRDPIGHARTPWKQSLALPASFQMINARRLMESRPFFSRVPDQSLIVSENPEDAAHIRACRGDGYAFLYLPYGGTVTVGLGTVSGSSLRASWFDPRLGESTLIGEVENTGTVEFSAPGERKRGNDWVLVLDDASKGFSLPG